MNQQPTPRRPVPVILDTDIGGDIDDTWALAMMLRMPELAPRLVLTDTGDTDYRSRLTAKLLEVAGRTDIPVGVGVNQGAQPNRERQKPWLADYRLSDYPGVVHEDGVQAMIDLIMTSPEPITLIAIGPAPNLALALKQEPAIAPRTHFVGMFGSIAWAHETNMRLSMKPGRIAEFNVVRDIPAAQAVFAAPWRSATITPLDTCGFVALEGQRYARCRDATDPLLAAVIENYRIWSPGPQRGNDAEAHSSVLYDTVAIHLAASRRYLRMQPMMLTVDDAGFLNEDPAGRPFDVAIAWDDLDGYLDELVAILCGEKASSEPPTQRGA